MSCIISWPFLLQFKIWNLSKCPSVGRDDTYEYRLRVHRCGASGSMRACHAAGPGSGQVSWVRFFRGFSSPVRQMSGSFRPPRSPNIIWPSLSILLIHYGRQWHEMLTRLKTSSIQMYHLRHGQLARWIKWRTCDVRDAKEGLENECDVGEETEGFEIELWCR